ncbi:hypothetical protein ACWDFR_07815 [Streptomyces sp. 900105755]
MSREAPVDLLIAEGVPGGPTATLWIGATGMTLSALPNLLTRPRRS